MSKAQINTLFEQINSGNIQTNEARILRQIMRRTEKAPIGYTLSDLNHLLRHLKESTIVARLSALEDKGLIYKSKTLCYGDDKKKKKFYSTYLYEPNPLKQEANRYKIDDIKYQKWVKSGLNRFTHQMSDELQRELENELI